MSEIEKMYENARIYPDCKARECGLDYCANSSGCGYAVYPDFTAKKQIAILCWLVNLKGNVAFNNKPKDITPERLQEALAWAVNQYWTKLTPEQQRQVKGILK